MTDPVADAPDSQEEVIRFLADPRAYGGHIGNVERCDTHAAIVFLAGARAYKIKRAVRFPYVDFATREKRHVAIDRELEVNRLFAPDLYIGTSVVTCEADGRLALGGTGTAVENVLVMRRFAEADLLSRMAAGGKLTEAQAADVADAVFRSHELCAPAEVPDAVARLSALIETLAIGLREVAALLAPSDPNGLCAQALGMLQRTQQLIEQRAAQGFIRRCHGDLHLNNIVLIDGRPTLFDALDFDDRLATVDTLHDLAFLLMDLDHVGKRRLANVVLNRYLWRAGDTLAIEGLATLPLFLALRSGVRALVTAERAAQKRTDAKSAEAAAARGYLVHALTYLDPPAPRLVVIGGLSGTGKTRAAASLAPELGAAPGALHLRSDLERKAMHGVEATERRPAAAYTREAARAVYDRVLEKARIALRAEHAVVVDATFLEAGEQRAVEDMATRAGVPFTGIWLTAPREVLLARVSARQGDASDATVDVVERQLASGADGGSWHAIDAGGSPEETLERVRAVLS